MGLADNKKDVFTTIGAYTSLNEEQNMPETNNTFNSINNDDNIGEFLLDILNVVVGTTALQLLVGELFTNFIDSVEPQLKSATKKQLIKYNSGNNLPDSFKNGIEIPAKDIDVYDKLKTDPQSEVGDMLYDNNNKNFDKKARDAIVNAGTDVEYNNVLMNYDIDSDSFKFKPTENTKNQKIGEWMGDFVDETQFINKKEFSTNVINNIFGSVSNNQDKSIEKLTEEVEIDELIEQAINGDDSFNIPEDKYDEIINKAQELKNGVNYYDMGCGILEAELPISGLTNLISNLSGSTDPNDVSNKINDTLNDGFQTTDNQETKDNNSETIRNGFFNKILNYFRLELVKSLTLTPQSRMLFGLSSAFENNGIPQISNPKEDLKKFKRLINCLIKEMLSSIYEFIFSLIVTYLIKLINPVIKKIIREKINQYINIIKSLISSNI